MNLNYVGSVAERFMKFRSSLATEENIDSNLFNAISIYVPKSLAEANLATGSYTPSAVTADAYAVIAVTVDNYKKVLADGSVCFFHSGFLYSMTELTAVLLFISSFSMTQTLLLKLKLLQLLGHL